jgi:hypothetical protein
MPKTPPVTWAAEPAEHDYPAAASYLELITTTAHANHLVSLLKQAPGVDKHVKDILRAAGLPLLPADDPEVAKDLKRVRKGTALSPVLLIRGNAFDGHALQVADGYHRLCASYHLSEDTEIPCKIVDLERPAR